MTPVAIEVLVPLSTIALCLITGGIAVALAMLTAAVVGLYRQVRSLEARTVDAEVEAGLALEKVNKKDYEPRRMSRGD